MTIFNKQKINTAINISLRSCGILCFLILFFLLSLLIVNGINSIDLNFLTSSSKNFGAEGGIFYQIIGSLLLTLMSACITLPLALGTALFKSEFISSSRIQTLSDSLLYTLNGIPSIIFGLFGLIFFINILDTGISWFVGAIILSMMILPTVTLSAFQSMHSLPRNYRENAYALGMNTWQVIYKVVIPQGLTGAVSGLLIGLARAIGETAPILFVATAFSGAQVPQSLFEPVAALPTHILVLAQNATDPLALKAAWGSSLVLITLVFLFSLIAFISRKNLQLLSQR